MKKFFAKHDLFKIVAILMFLTAILTWIFRVSMFQNGELVTFSEEVKGISAIVDDSTIGVFDFNAYFFLVFYVFSNTFVFIFLIHALYKVLGKSKVYATIVDKAANLFKGKEIVFAGISMVFYAAFTSVANDLLACLLFVPFTISIFNKLKVDKLSTFASTFGGVLIGIVSATYSTAVMGSIINYAAMPVKFGNEMLSAIIVTVIALALLTTLVAFRIKSKDKKDVVEEKFITAEVITEAKGKKKKKKQSIVPMAIALFIFAIIVILGFIPWETFKVTAFTKLHENISNATLFGANYPKILLGTAQMSQTTYSIQALGTWDITILSAFILLMIFVFKVIAGIKLDDMIDGIGEGLKQAVKPAILLAMIYTILAFTVSYPVVPYFINSINKAFSANALKPIGYVLNMVITTVFTGDIQYAMSMLGGLFQTFKNEQVVAFAMQTGYAFAGFVAPTSVLLMLGLSMLDIKFKDYFKFMWKFILGFLAIILIVLYILLFV